VALADVYDALSSRRCYKEPWPQEKVIEFLREQRGRHFDPDLVDCMMDCLPEVHAIMASHEDTDEDFQLLESPARPLIQSEMPQTT